MYLYQLNYPVQEKEICFLEMKRMFKQVPISHFVCSELCFEAGRSVYFKSRLDILFQSDSLENLCFAIQEAALSYDLFKVIYLKSDEDTLTYEERLFSLKQVAKTILGTHALSDPKYYLGVVFTNGIWYFGLVAKDHQSWQQRQHKPQSYSQSLSARIARTLVNIASCGDLSCHMIDPCCGVGTVVLEALSMGHYIAGSDIHRGICWKANRNLEYFGYPTLIQNCDIAAIGEYYDACILDIPYNLYSSITPEQQLAILHHTFRIADVLVLISHEDLSEQVNQVGWVINENCLVGKMKFKRYVYVCKKII